MMSSPPSPILYPTAAPEQDPWPHQKKLFHGTVPSMKKLFDGTLGTNWNKLFEGPLVCMVPSNNKLFDETVPATKQLFDGTVPSNSFSHNL